MHCDLAAVLGKARSFSNPLELQNFSLADQTFFTVTVTAFPRTRTISVWKPSELHSQNESLSTYSFYWMKVENCNWYRVYSVKLSAIAHWYNKLTVAWNDVMDNLKSSPPRLGGEVFSILVLHFLNQPYPLFRSTNRNKNAIFMKMYLGG